jgi:hypothetical protein
MPVQQLIYAQIAERLGVTSEAARAIVKRHRLPRSRSNDGKTLVAVDFDEVQHKPLPTRSPRRSSHLVRDCAGAPDSDSRLHDNLDMMCRAQPNSWVRTTAHRDTIRSFEVHVKALAWCAFRFLRAGIRKPASTWEVQS